MKLFKLKKVLAGFLAFVMVAGYTSSVSAATSTSTLSSSSSSSNFDEALEQLNDATWSEYYWLVEGEHRYDGAPVAVDTTKYTFAYPDGFTTADTDYPVGTVSEMQAELAALNALATLNDAQKLKKQNLEKILAACADKGTAISTPDIGTTTWTFEVPEDGLYALDMLYYPTEAKSAKASSVLIISISLIGSTLPAT